MKKSNYIIFFAILFYSCDRFEYSHNQVLPDEKYKNINQNNILRFINIVTDTVTIAIIGDSQRYFKATQKVISKINNIPDIHFVVHTGDLADFGIQKEYRWLHEQLSKIKYPYVAVIGNHDLIGNGGEIYNLMYGDPNFSFIFNENKFIYLNTNAREYSPGSNVPDITWLNKELSDTSVYKNAIIVCHSPHTDLDPVIQEKYLEILRKYKKVLLCINGHLHNFNFTAPGGDGIAYLSSFTTVQEKFVVIRIWDNKFSLEIINNLL